MELKTENATYPTDLDINKINDIASKIQNATNRRTANYVQVNEELVPYLPFLRKFFWLYDNDEEFRNLAREIMKEE